MRGFSNEYNDFNNKYQCTNGRFYHQYDFKIALKMFFFFIFCKKTSTFSKRGVIVDAIA